MCSACLLVDLFTKDFAYELQIYKKRANWQAWVALQLARIIVLLFIAHLAPGGGTLYQFLLSQSLMGGRISLSLPYPFPRDEAAEKCPTRDASPPLEAAF